MISRRIPSVKEVHIANDSYKFKIDLDKKQIQNNGYVAISSEDTLLKILSSHDDTRLTINKKELIDLLDIIGTVNINKNQIQYKVKLIEQISLLYDLEFDDLSKNNIDDKGFINNNIIDRLICFAADFFIPMDKSLADLVEENLSAALFYYKIIAYKRMIIDLINDANVFTCFNKYW